MCFFFCFMAEAAAPLSEMVYVQGAGLKTSYDNTSCSRLLFEENHVPGVSHHLPGITPRVALFPPSVLSMWTSKSFGAEANFPLLTLGITAENECIRMFPQQMESPDVIAHLSSLHIVFNMTAPACTAAWRHTDGTGGVVLNSRPTRKRPSTIWPTSMEKTQSDRGWSCSRSEFVMDECVYSS